MSDTTKLYRKEEVPEDLKGRGVWQRFGNETLFSPFGGTPELVNPTDWICEHCKQPWYRNQVVKNEYHCPRCGRWWSGSLEVD